MAKMPLETAIEHARDGADCMVEGAKSIKRLKKAFPDHAAALDQAAGHMSAARIVLAAVEASLTSQQAKQ